MFLHYDLCMLQAAHVKTAPYGLKGGPCKSQHCPSRFQSHV